MTTKNDFEFLFGDWKVRHRKLTARLAGANDWKEFNGTSTTRPLMGGQGNVEDNYIGDPAGPYRAAALRTFQADTGLWRIWWLDMRLPSQIGLPVVGAFEGDRGEFVADDHWNGIPIRVRFLWIKSAEGGPLWQQAFSSDGGSTWEVNWTMQFSPK